MGWMAERFGIRRVVMFGAAMVAAGLAISTLRQSWPRSMSGTACLSAFSAMAASTRRCYVYVARWFDRRRGSAVALISSGQYLAGTVWPILFSRGIEALGWRGMMLGYAVFVVVMIVPIALAVFRPAAGGRRRRSRLAARCAAARCSACGRTS